MKERIVKGNAIKNIFFQGLSGIIAKVGSLVFTVIIARILFPELFGLYSLALSIILTVLTFSEVGIGLSMVRYVSESLGKKNILEARSRFLFLLKSKVLIGIIISLLLFFFAGVISSFYHFPELKILLEIGSIYLFISMLYGAFTPLFLTFQELKYFSWTEFIFESSRIILAGVLLYFYKTVTTVFISLIISLFLAFFVALFICIKKYPFLIKGKRIKVERKRIISFSGFLTLGSLSLVIFANIDRLVLGYFINLDLIGIYAAIMTLISGVIGIVGFSSVFLPAFTQTKGKKLKELFRKTLHYSSLIVFPASIGLAFTALPLLRVLYGVDYVPGQYRLTIIITSALLSLLIIENVFSALYKTLFDSREMPKIPAFANLIAAILNVILDIMLVYYFIKIKPEYGLIGAALATFLTRYAVLFTLIFSAKTKMNISPYKSSIIKPLFSTLIMSLYLLAYYSIFDINLLSGILMILTSILVYSLVIIGIKGVKIEELKKILKDLFSQENK